MRIVYNACRVSALALIAAAFLSAPAGAQEAGEADLEILLSTIQANKKALVAVNLELEDAEARVFWPVYDRYQGELEGVRGRFLALIEDYVTSFKTMSDEEATRIAALYLALEQERTAIRQEYHEPFSDALPGRKLARYYQIENKIDAILRYRLARDIPVIDSL